jgi:hypothetical protein
MYLAIESRQPSVDRLGRCEIEPASNTSGLTAERG